MKSPSVPEQHIGVPIATGCREIVECTRDQLIDLSMPIDVSRPQAVEHRRRAYQGVGYRHIWDAGRGYVVQRTMLMIDVSRPQSVDAIFECTEEQHCTNTPKTTANVVLALTPAAMDGARILEKTLMEVDVCQGSRVRPVKAELETLKLFREFVAAIVQNHTVLKEIFPGCARIWNYALAHPED